MANAVEVLWERRQLKFHSNSSPEKLATDPVCGMQVQAATTKYKTTSG
jgi:hypothetical protein